MCRNGTTFDLKNDIGYRTFTEKVNKSWASFVLA